MFTLFKDSCKTSLVNLYVDFFFFFKHARLFALTPKRFCLCSLSISEFSTVSLSDSLHIRDICIIKAFNEELFLMLSLILFRVLELMLHTLL